MRKVFVTSALVLAVLSSAAQNSLVVDFVLNRPEAGGTMRMVLCPNAEAFTSERGCLLKQVPATGALVRAVFENVTKGDYAIKVFHDVNDNGVLDTNWMGIPKEPYGFSQDAMGTFGPPDFGEASFEVGEGRTTARIRMKG